MRCPKCNKDLGDKAHKFCPGCGEALSTPQPVIPAKKPEPVVPEWEKYMDKEKKSASNSPPPTSSAKHIYMPPQPNPADRVGNENDTKSELKDALSGVANVISKKVSKKSKAQCVLPQSLIPDLIEPCTDEKPIKQYVFSKLKMSFPVVYNASGILQVTNKRIIYNLIGDSGAESERTHSEFSIDDVSGITVEKSSKIKLSKIIPYMLIGIVLFLILQKLGGLIASIPYVGSLLCCVIGCLGIVLSSKISNNDKLSHYVCAVFGDLTIGALIVLPRISASSGVEEILLGISTILLPLLAGMLVILNIGSYLMVLPQPIISVIITSKSGAATPINASSFSPKRALKSMCDVEPTIETDIMIRELGALVSDVQKQGDYAIAKWSK